MAFEALAGLDSISIYQKTSKIEALTAMAGNEWDRPNKYKIKDSYGRDLLYAEEQTGCCRRQLKATCPDCMSWEIRFSVKSDGWLTGGWKPAFDLHRNFQLTCCCFNRPRAALMAAEDHSIVFGHITNPCSLCPAFTVLNTDEEPVLRAATNGCQPGLYFPFPCGPCAHVRFDLQDPDGNSLGEIDKEVPCGRCCCKFLAPGQDVDNYHIDLSKMPDPSMKALAVALAVFIDFRYFSEVEKPDEPSQETSE
eukprot:CAMPEP_0117511232 /NCGR_PEP_ID=MMETSP0784-20121206/28400_1 /TAXON_ID=39447 /ORGANISM="" /LENGTH=250 /DNA_ID=CAMNT_0005306895 /DNA_START=13 /DNA_END=765 /DNA_ORIENTATION=+